MSNLFDAYKMLARRVIIQAKLDYERQNCSLYDVQTAYDFLAGAHKYKEWREVICNMAEVDSDALANDFDKQKIRKYSRIDY